MMDLLCIVLTVGFFAVSWKLIRLMEKV